MTNLRGAVNVLIFFERYREFLPLKSSLETSGDGQPELLTR